MILAVLPRPLVVTAFANAESRAQNTLEAQSMDVAMTNVAFAIVRNFLLDVTTGDLLSLNDWGGLIFLGLAPFEAL